MVKLVWIKVVSWKIVHTQYLRMMKVIMYKTLWCSSMTVTIWQTGITKNSFWNCKKDILHSIRFLMRNWNYRLVLLIHSMLLRVFSISMIVTSCLLNGRILSQLTVEWIVNKLNVSTGLWIIPLLGIILLPINIMLFWHWHKKLKNVSIGQTVLKPVTFCHLMYLDSTIHKMVISRQVRLEVMTHIRLLMV